MDRKRSSTLEPKDMVITIVQKPANHSRHVITVALPPINYPLNTGPVRIFGLALVVPKHPAPRVGSVRVNDR